MALAARAASQVLATVNRARKDEALQAMADALAANAAAVIEANAKDVERGRQNGLTEALIDRLALNQARVDGMVEGLRQVASLPDPIGEVVRGWRMGNGVQVNQVRAPMGVIGIIYEARPNVTADAAGICLKAGSAALLRGSSSALESNRAVVAALRAGLQSVDLPEALVNLVEGGYEVTDEMMQARGLIDLLIPRGGAGLIESIVTGSTVPVIETGTGNCHLYVDQAADQDMAIQIMLNAKVQRPSVCNALETLLVHADIADEFLPRAINELLAAGVTVHGDGVVQGFDPEVVPAADDEFDEEYLSLDAAAAVVADLDAAIAHIQRHGSGHSETIITQDSAAAERFVAEVDAAAVLVNASSRFVDGGEFGFGTEIGISTQKLHARGPMALPEMTTTKFVVRGSGQTRG